MYVYISRFGDFCVHDDNNDNDNNDNDDTTDHFTPAHARGVMKYSQFMVQCICPLIFSQIVQFQLEAPHVYSQVLTVIIILL